jgi:hypothetical protein
MRKGTLVASFAICAAVAACDGSITERQVTAPPPPLLSATAADPGTTPYDWTAAPLGEGEPVDATQAATGGRASGFWRLAMPLGNRAAEDHAFTALSTGPLGAAKGEVQVHTTFTTGVEANVHVDVDCLVVVGTQAWFSGPARRFVFGGIEQPPGLYLVFRVEDNGEGAGAPPDRGSPAFSGPPMGCRLMPPFPLVATNGNIQVRQR